MNQSTVTNVISNIKPVEVTRGVCYANSLFEQISPTIDKYFVVVHSSICCNYFSHFWLSSRHVHFIHSPVKMFFAATIGQAQPIALVDPNVQYTLRPLVRMHSPFAHSAHGIHTPLNDLRNPGLYSKTIFLLPWSAKWLKQLCSALANRYFPCCELRNSSINKYSHMCMGYLAYDAR